MHRILRPFILMLTFTFALMASATGVKDLHNVHLDDVRRYVTDQAGIMNSSQIAQADAIIGQIWAKTSAEIIVVIVDRSENDDANTLATDVFTDWGIGKKDKDNGVLLLVDNENHEVVIRTGYGTEGVLPDIIAGRIIRNTIIPAIREDGVGAGVIAGLSEIEKVMTNPEYAEELRSSIANDSRGSQTDDGWTGSDTFMVVVMFIGLIAFAYLMKKKAEGPTKCPKCGTQLEPTNPSAIMTYLNPSQQTEQRIGARSYKALQCPADGTVVLSYTPGPQSSRYHVCTKCGAQAVESRTMVQNGRPTNYISETCLNCGNNRTRRKDDTASKVLLGTLAASALRGILRGGGGGFGGGFGGGSMGGGRTGGGGASGRW